MKARAPGKLVLSGAYSVLSGAPAIVTAVSRYVVADTSRQASFLAAEVQEAVRQPPFIGLPPPWFDATELRSEGQKLGLGSSAAITAACLAALFLEHQPDAKRTTLAEHVFLPALRAHRAAQGGGSGVDVLAACFGGTRLVRKVGDELEHQEISLPAGIQLTVLSAGAPASTQSLLGLVRALKADDPRLAEELLGRQTEASHAAADAASNGDAHAFLSALAAQRRALSSLGRAAGAPIVTPELQNLSDRLPHGVVLPAGAGGGDVAIWASDQPLSTQARQVAIECGHRPLCCQIGASGVQAVE